MQTPEGRKFSPDLATKFQKLQPETGSELEIVSEVPIFTLKKENTDSGAIRKILDAFGENTILRVINSHFLKDAVEFGTDRVHIDEHDFRSVIHYITGYGYGHDIWNVTGRAKERGLTAADVFCGTTRENFKNDKLSSEGYSSSGLGIPDDRSAILIFDDRQLEKIKDSDGYIFKDPKNKKRALLGVIKFEEQFFPFEEELQRAQSTNEQITLLENEITQNMSGKDGRTKTFYIALHIVTLLRETSIQHTKESSTDAEQQLQRLKDLVERLKLETQRISIVQNHRTSIKIVQNWIEKQKRQANQPETVQTSFEKLNAKAMPRRPDKIIERIQQSLVDPTLPEAYKRQLRELIEEAGKCKEEMKRMPL